MKPVERLKRRGATTASTESHTISRRQQDVMDTQLTMMYDIATTFNQCVCGVPIKPEKGTKCTVFNHGRLGVCIVEVANCREIIQWGL